jgi:hypothetical protein
MWVIQMEDSPPSKSHVITGDVDFEIVSKKASYYLKSGSEWGL